MQNIADDDDCDACQWFILDDDADYNIYDDYEDWKKSNLGLICRWPR